MTTTTTTTRTITLTGRPPVRIDEASWPIIADSWYSEHDGEVECQANRRTKGWLKVRQHADGRAIVYGRYDYESAWQHERSVMLRGGVLLPAGADVASAIFHVADELIERGAPDRMRDVAHEVVSDLPAERI